MKIDPCPLCAAPARIRRGSVRYREVTGYRLQCYRCNHQFAQLVGADDPETRKVITKKLSRPNRV